MSPGSLAFLPVPAAGTGGIEGTGRQFTVMDPAYPVQGCNQLTAVPWLDLMETGDPVRNILHVATLHFTAGHLLKAECHSSDPDPVRSIRTRRHRARSPDNRERAIRKYPVDHPDNTLFIREDPDISLLRGVPGFPVARQGTRDVVSPIQSRTAQRG